MVFRVIPIVLACLVLAACAKKKESFFSFDYSKTTAEALEVRKNNKAIVSACLEEREVGASAFVSHYQSWLCKKPALHHGVLVRYGISREESELKVSLFIYLRNEKKTDEEKKNFLSKAQGCIQPIHDVLARYGIDFDLQITAPEKDVLDLLKPGEAQLVTFEEGSGRGNAYHWYLRDGAAELCQMIIHEAGHMLGLPDEYSDAECPDRETIRSEAYPRPKSIMDNPFLPWAGVDFYPRHILSLVEPLCPKTSEKLSSGQKVETPSL